MTAPAGPPEAIASAPGSARASDAGIATGFRRRILIEPAPGRVTAELEDDYHRMVVTLHHAGGRIVQAAGEMKRSPWTACPGAIARLAETFAGVALVDAARAGEKSTNCTHLHDLALWAAAHAGSAAAIAYEVFASDPRDGVRTAILWRDGTESLCWTLAGDRFLAPAELAGQTLFGISPWIAGLDAADREAARILRWATIVGMGRVLDMPAGIPATSFPLGACYNFQPERAATSLRRSGADVDFSSDGREPMADRAASFGAACRRR